MLIQTSCLTPRQTSPHEISAINNAVKCNASHARVTSTYRSHLLSSSDVLQNLFQLLLNASSPVNHSGEIKLDIFNLHNSTLSHNMSLHKHSFLCHCMWVFLRPWQRESLPQSLWILVVVVNLPNSPPYLRLSRSISVLTLLMSGLVIITFSLPSHLAYIWWALAGLAVNVPVLARLGSAALQ